MMLLFFCLLSGSFGQLRVEENYPTNNLSYSQWETYYPLLYNKQFCIPVNHYPFLLHQNCNYLLYRNPENIISHNKPVTHISLSHITPYAKDWRVIAVVLINNPNQFISTAPSILYAYDSTGKIIGIAKQLVPGNYAFIYYLFDKEIVSPEELMLKSKTGKNLKITPDIVVFGTSVKGSHQGIMY